MFDPPWTGLGRVEAEISSIKSELNRKADSHETHSLRSDVDRLEHTVRELRTEVDGVRVKRQEMEGK